MMGTLRGRNSIASPKATDGDAISGGTARTPRQAHFPTNATRAARPNAPPSSQSEGASSNVADDELHAVAHLHANGIETRRERPGLQVDVYAEQS